MGCQKLVNKKKYCAFFALFLTCTFMIIAGGILIVSAFPQFDAQTKEITFGDVTSDYSTNVIPLDDTISSIKLNLIQQVNPNSEVNISISSMKPTKSSKIGHRSFDKVYMLAFGTFFRSGYNYLGLDEPIYLLPESTLIYQLDTANAANIRLCIFNDSLAYAHFLSDYSYKCTSCFNATNNGSYTFNITEPSSYYVAIEVSDKVNVVLKIRGNVTVTRFYYNISNMELSNESPYSMSADNPFCEITICSGYFCHWLKKKYLMLQSTGTVTLKYSSYETFLVKSTVLRIVLFTLASVILILIAFFNIAFFYFKCFGGKAKEWSDNNREVDESTPLLASSGSRSSINNDNENTSKKKNCCNVEAMFNIALILITLCSFCAVILMAASLIISSQPRSVNTDINVGIGNKHPVLLDPNGFKATSSVTVKWTFPRAESIAVYKTPCNKLTTSSTTLPVHYIPNLSITCSNPRNGFNYNQYGIPLNLAKGSNVTYNITVTSSSSKSHETCSSSPGITCLRLLLMNTQGAYNEFLGLRGSSNSTNYVSRSQCLDLQNSSSYTFQINRVQGDYYVGIESPVDITVNATVSGVQVYYDTSDLDNVCPDLSISNQSCTVPICPKWMCLKYDQHICILVNSSSPDEVSYHSSPAILTGKSVHLFYAAVSFAVCGFGVVIIFVIPTLLCHCVSMRASIYRKLKKPVDSIWKHKKKFCCFATCGIISLIMLVMSATILVWNPWKFSKENLLRAKDYISLDQGISWPWFAVSGIYVSVQNESDSSNLEIDLYSIPCSEVTVYHLNISHTTKCTDWSGPKPCILHEYLYIVRTENVSLNFSITLTTKFEELQFRVSVFDDDKTYESFLSTEQYQPLKTVVFNGLDAEPILFNLSYTEMKKQAAYYHIVIHPSVPSQYLQQETNHSQIDIRHNGVIGYYNLANFTPIVSLENSKTYTLKHSSNCHFAYSEFDSSNSSDNSTHILQKSPNDIQLTPYRLVSLCIVIMVLVAIVACTVLVLKRIRNLHPTTPTEHQNETVAYAPMSSYQPKLLMDERTKETLSRIFDELTELTVDSSGLIHHCSQYDVTLIIPEGAVQQPATVWIGACLFSDKFQFEDDYVPVTPFVFVYIDCELVKEAELYLSHYIDTTSNDDVANDFVILAADDESITAIEEKMCFKQSTDYFLQESWKGSTTLSVLAKHFCTQCGALDREKHKTSKKKFLMMKAEKREGNDIVCVDICLLYPTCYKTVETQYQENDYVCNKHNVVFEFEERCQGISLRFDPETMRNWARFDLTPYHRYISADQIDYDEIYNVDGGVLLQKLQDELSYPPRFRLKFQKIGAGLNDQIKIHLDGTAGELTIPVNLGCAGGIENTRPHEHDAQNLTDIDVHTGNHLADIIMYQERAKVKPRKNPSNSACTPVPESVPKEISTLNSEFAGVHTAGYPYEQPRIETGARTESHTVDRPGFVPSLKLTKPPKEYRADIAYDVLKTNTSRIKESKIGLAYLADKLADAKIINDSQKTEASDVHTGRTEDERMDKLLTTLKATVKEDGSWFGWFIQVLRDMDTVLANKIADELVEKYKLKVTA